MTITKEEVQKLLDEASRIPTDNRALIKLRNAAGFIARFALAESARADQAEAANAALEARVAGLCDFIEDFAKAKIDALRYSPPHGSSPEDEPDPVVDAETVWAWQSDARDALATALVVSEAGGATSAVTTPQPGEVPASSAPAPALASGKPGEAGNG